MFAKLSVVLLCVAVLAIGASLILNARLKQVNYSYEQCKISLQANAIADEIEDDVDGWTNTELDDWLRDNGLLSSDSPMRSDAPSNRGVVGPDED